MTDTFIVDRSGEFVVGKAQTTPEDASIGFMSSTRDGSATPPTDSIPYVWVGWASVSTATAVREPSSCLAVNGPSVPRRLPRGHAQRVRLLGQSRR